MIRILVPALVLCVAALPATAQTVQRRHVLRAAFQGDEPELDDEDQDTEQAVPDQPEDDGSEELHAFPRRRAVPSLPSSPEDEDEQPSAPPEQHLPADGLVEPASAMQPLSPE